LRAEIIPFLCFYAFVIVSLKCFWEPFSLPGIFTLQHSIENCSIFEMQLFLYGKRLFNNAEQSEVTSANEQYYLHLFDISRYM